jgi:hypothetical protein
MPASFAVRSVWFMPLSMPEKHQGKVAREGKKPKKADFFRD